MNDFFLRAGDYIWRKIYSFLIIVGVCMPWLVSLILVILLLNIVIKKGLTFDQLIRLIEVIKWPLVVFVAIVLFKKIFTYLFFSLEEFNFFGTRGKLIDVREMIKSKAQELFQQKEAEEYRKKEKDEMKQEMEKIIAEKGESSEQTERVIKIAEKALKDNDELLKENFDLKMENQQLSYQVKTSYSSVDSVSFENEEEYKDVGLTETIVANQDQSKEQ